MLVFVNFVPLPSQPAVLSPLCKWKISPSLVYQTQLLLDSPKVRISKVFILWSSFRLHYLHHQEGLLPIPFPSTSLVVLVLGSTFKVHLESIYFQGPSGVLSIPRFIEDLFQVSLYQDSLETCLKFFGLVGVFCVENLSFNWFEAFLFPPGIYIGFIGGFCFGIHWQPLSSPQSTLEFWLVVDLEFCVWRSLAICLELSFGV